MEQLSLSHISSLNPFVDFLDNLGTNPERYLERLGFCLEDLESDRMMPTQKIRDLMADAKNREGKGVWYFAARSQEWMLSHYKDCRTVNDALLKYQSFSGESSNMSWINLLPSDRGVWLTCSEHDLDTEVAGCSAQVYMCTLFVSLVQHIYDECFEPERVLSHVDCREFFKRSEEFSGVEVLDTHGHFGIEIPGKALITPCRTSSHICTL